MSASIAYSPYRHLIWLLVVLLFGLVCRIIFLNAPLQSDDTSYFQFAQELDAEFFTEAYYQAHFRVGMLAVLAAVQSLFGYSLTSYYLFSLGSSLFLLAMVYLLAFKAGGLGAALASSLLFACSFFGLFQTTNLLPDVPSAALLFAAFLVFVNADEKTSKHRFLLLFLAAFLAFWSYLVRAPNLVFLLAIPVYEALVRKSVRSTFLFSISFFLLWVGEGVLYAIIAGDFFLRIKMIAAGTASWTIHMAEIGWKQFFLEPLILLNDSFAGKVILFGGAAGVFFAFLRRNFIMIALLAGALLLFLIYSYAVTSIDPLKRALPLNVRYIVLFTAALTLATGYALSSLKLVVEKLIPAKAAILILTSFVLALMIFQVRELPERLPYTILFNYSEFFVADRLVDDIADFEGLIGKVYAYPAKDFRMYKNFSKLNLKEVLPTQLEGGYWYLYSRKRVRADLIYRGWERLARFEEYEEITGKLNLLMWPEVPTWDYVLNIKDIALAYIPTFSVEQEPVLRLPGSYFLGKWGKPKGVRAEKKEDATLFTYGDREAPFYLFTFPGSFERPPKDDVNVFNKLKPGEIYELNIQYRLKKSIQNLVLFYSQYDSTEKIDTISTQVPSSEGVHVLTQLVGTEPSYEKFRMFFRVNDQKKENQLAIESISFSILRE